MPKSGSKRVSVIPAILTILVILVIYYEFGRYKCYSNMKEVSINKYLESAQTGDIIFTQQKYGFPKFAPHMYGLSAIQYIATDIPFTHVVTIVRGSDIPEPYKSLWRVQDSAILVYSSEATACDDVITGTKKEGTSLRDARSYLYSYTGNIVVLRVRAKFCAKTYMGACARAYARACAYMHSNRNRLFNRNIFRYFNIELGIWKNTYNPVRSLCTEICYELLKKLGSISSELHGPNVGLRSLLEATEQSGNYESELTYLRTCSENSVFSSNSAIT